MTEAARPFAAPGDRAALGWLGASNALTIAIALWQRWPLALLLWPFWVQSLVIGYYSVRRILGLRRFSVTGFRIGGRPAQMTDQTLRSTAVFFTFHYGFFHLLYFVFLAKLEMAREEWLWIGVAALAFVANHRRSYLRYREADAQGMPNLGALMFLPYLRVVPMHLMIIFGVGLLGGSALAVLLFGLLKTIADCAMHVAEHRILARAAPASQPGG